MKRNSTKTIIEEIKILRSLTPYRARNSAGSRESETPEVLIAGKHRGQEGRLPAMRRYSRRRCQVILKSPTTAAGR